jgi:hypothetical protein
MPSQPRASQEAFKGGLFLRPRESPLVHLSCRRGGKGVCDLEREGCSLCGHFGSLAGPLVLTWNEASARGVSVMYRHVPPSTKVVLGFRRTISNLDEVGWAR